MEKKSCRDKVVAIGFEENSCQLQTDSPTCSKQFEIITGNHYEQRMDLCTDITAAFFARFYDQETCFYLQHCVKIAKDAYIMDRMMLP